MQTNTELAVAVANAMGYTRFAPHNGIATWYPDKQPAVAKGQHVPRIEAYRALVRVYGPDWFIDLYSWQGTAELTPNVVGITGNVEGADLDFRKAVDGLPRGLADMYERKLVWLRQNPMYRRSAVKTAKKREHLNPSQLIA